MDRKELVYLVGRKKLPVGIENFAKIRTEGFYYVDKTGLIKELLYNWGEVNLFTRPRRFGKSLNMNMLKSFFEYGCDSSLFEGLEISGEKELCRKYMGQFPVISISLKDIDARNYEGAKAALYSVINREARRLHFQMDSLNFSDEESLKNSLLNLSEFLYKNYRQKVILLIDEYDVPLDKAYLAGYYDEMLHLMRGLLSRVLKSNDNLYFAVLTGCLRIAKESVFTGLNNFKTYSITDVRFNEYFGFSDGEVREMLDYYGVTYAYGTVKEWYDGYNIGNTDIYCPWDVINYVDLLRVQTDAEPKAFWVNTSSNDVIRKFLRAAKQSTRREIEALIDGGRVRKKINQELTYRELYENIENLWSVLFTTGYLTQRGKAEGDVYWLVIPNREICEIFTRKIQEWFQEESKKDTLKLDAFCKAFEKADTSLIEKQFNAYLLKTISIRDTAVRKDKKENFYHGILLGLLSHREDWDVRSNAESGYGYSDILIEIEEKAVGIVIEVKYAENGNFNAAIQDAFVQIEEKNYETRLVEDGMETIIKYGIACWKKKCRAEVCFENKCKVN